MGDMIDFRGLDLSNPSEVSVATTEIAGALLRRRRERFQSSASSFILDLFPNLIISPTFLDHLCQIPHESVRVILIFFANTLQYTYFRSSSTVCAFCSSQITSRHLFNCSGISSSPICNWPAFVHDFQVEDFGSALDRLFLVIQRWSILTNRFQPALTATLDEYFTCTQYRSRRVNVAWSLSS